MTRGRIAIISPDGRLVTSVEFNGDMYYKDGHGEEVFSGLDDIESEEEFIDFVTEFNREHFGYTDRELWYCCENECFDLRHDYYDNWFSDYIYIKNLSDQAQTFIDCNGEKVILGEGERAAFYFGEYIAGCEEDFLKLIFLEDLQELKENLTYNHDDNYRKIYNRCREYDDETGEDVCDMIDRYDFVYDETLEFIVRENADDFARLFYFMKGVEHINDDIYILDGYGNLRNVDKGDFENLIDDITYRIDRELSPPKHNFSMG